MSQQNRKGWPQGSTVDDMLAKMEKWQASSPEQRSAELKAAAQRAKKVKISDEDYAMMMAADGYFPNENGEID